MLIPTSEDEYPSLLGLPEDTVSSMFATDPGIGWCMLQLFFRGALLLVMFVLTKAKYHKLSPGSRVGCPQRWARELKCEARRRKLRKGCGGGGYSGGGCFFSSSAGSCPFDAVMARLQMPPPLPFRRRRGKCAAERETDTSVPNVAPTNTDGSQKIQPDESNGVLTSPTTALMLPVMATLQAIAVPVSLSSSSTPALASFSDSTSTIQSSEEESEERQQKQQQPQNLPPTKVRATIQSHTALLNMARMQQWDAIEQYSTRKAAKYADADGLYPLHWASSGGPPATVIQTLLRAYRKAAHKTDSEGSTALHFACHYGASAAVIDTLLQEYPRAATLQDRYGRTPLYHAASKGAGFEAVQTLVDANPSTVLIPCHAQVNASGSQCQQEADGPQITPLYVTWMAFFKDHQARLRRSGKKWDKAVLLLEKAYLHHLDCKTPNHRPRQPRSFQLLPAILNFAAYLPIQVIQFTVEAFPESIHECELSTGMHPLSLVALLAEPSMADSALQILLGSKSQGKIPDEIGAIALHHALQSGKRWDTGVSRLVDAFPAALYAIDPVSGLLPPLVAAAAVDPSEAEAVLPNPPLHPGAEVDVLRNDSVPKHIRNHKMYAWRQALSHSNGPSREAVPEDPGIQHVSTIYELLQRNPAALTT